MKKIFFICLIVLLVFLIYLCNVDKKIYYLVLGDPFGGYSTNVKKYFSDKKVLEKYVDSFAIGNMRTTDLTNMIHDNTNVMVYGKKIMIQNALIKADLLTLYFDASDLVGRDDGVYDYIDKLSIDLDNLFKLIRKYCKENIVLIGYYDFLDNDKVINYLNKKYKEVCDDYDITFVNLYDIFNENPDFLENNKITNKGLMAVSNEIIGVVNKKIFKT